VRTVYLVVHPEAEHHVQGLVGGWHDSQLTAVDEFGAQRIAEKLRATIPRRERVSVHSSDLSRTWRTAEVIGEAMGVVPYADRQLREMSYGEAEGRP